MFFQTSLTKPHKKNDVCVCVRPFKNKNKMYCAFNIFYGSMAL